MTFSHVIYLEFAWLGVCFIWVTEVSTTWMYMLFCTVLAQWIQHCTQYFTVFWGHLWPSSSSELELIYWHSWLKMDLAQWLMACKPSQGLSDPPISNVYWWLISSFQQPVICQHWASSNNGSSVVWWDCDIKQYLLCSWWRDFGNKFNQAPAVQSMMCGLYKICSIQIIVKNLKYKFRGGFELGCNIMDSKRIREVQWGRAPLKHGTQIRIRCWYCKKWFTAVRATRVRQNIVEMIWSISRCRMIYSMGCKMSFGSVTGFITHLSTSICTGDLSDTDGEHTLWAVLTHVREIKWSWRIIVGLKQWC